MADRILIVAAHADDEVIGCGGAIAWHAARGDDVRVLIMADGVTSRMYDPGISMSRAEELLACKQALEHRKAECLNAISLLGPGKDTVSFLDLADQRLDTYPFLDLVKHVEKAGKNFSPAIVYTHFFGDINLDHRLTTNAVLTAFRPWQKADVVIRLFEVPESTGISSQTGHASFTPDYFLDISQFWDHKQRALSVYTSESCEYPHPRSVQSLRERAAFWGKRARAIYGEAFLTCYEDSKKRFNHAFKAGAKD